ncbi:adenosine/AMP deaminase [Drepanopeziza brunnea f. sp. 'multigermtubi' MB_m1]|uniref:Adenosine/AMP deaminase n=1 Tax=Marssonina brunnea f. sp. multigermtubi (strain MB_m1) TaxID=1072389 RepID=K1WRU2_MARBU|nr:adenosine/AMP deaminase [Drepanopeziza brunnea f. sp. 'multigermtubi' MB_m1]EKD20370.1 adenosine/AMP deaminase [Drepanopeziza brunnea f. sp. 'multigermtubi' MB_m1]
MTNPDMDAYNNALQQLQLAEKARAFDAKITAASSDIEKTAADLVRKIKSYDWENTYGKPLNVDGKRTQGEHFLGNVDLINKTELMKVAKKMPKGAHLHIHFNSCLPARFLIRQARNVEAMYIRSSLPLVSPQNWIESRISFMVMSPEEACQLKDPTGNLQDVGLGSVFDDNYVSNRWMPYKQFQQLFYYTDNVERELAGTSGAETWLEHKMHISEEEAHGRGQTGRGIWEKFNHRTQMMKGLFAYESAFRNYTRACIEDFVQDNIQYAEIRPNFMATNTLKTDDGKGSIGNEGIMRIINEELQKTMAQIQKRGQYFGGMKVIYCTPRSFKNSAVEASLNECMELKATYKHLICGFDLVGHEEMGNELRNFVPEFLAFRKKCEAQNLDIPFLFHCGETLEVGDRVDGNLFDAVLLNAKRIGHGYALARHPLLMEKFKEKGIAIESCPISNEILGLTSTIAGHHLPILLANNVPCTVNSDNATFYKSSLSHDFYQVMIGAESMTLLGWKQLVKWSLEHSCMDPEQLKSVTAVWEVMWDEFCHWIVEEYGPRMQNWEPQPGRH